MRLLLSITLGHTKSNFAPILDLESVAQYIVQPNCYASSDLVLAEVGQLSVALRGSAAAGYSWQFRAEVWWLATGGLQADTAICEIGWFGLNFENGSFR